jgi:hypothetical protein
VIVYEIWKPSNSASNITGRESYEFLTLTVLGVGIPWVTYKKRMRTVDENLVENSQGKQIRDRAQYNIKIDFGEIKCLGSDELNQVKKWHFMKHNEGHVSSTKARIISFQSQNFRFL